MLIKNVLKYCAIATADGYGDHQLMFETDEFCEMFYLPDRPFKKEKRAIIVINSSSYLGEREHDYGSNQPTLAVGDGQSQTGRLGGSSQDEPAQ